MLRRYFIPIILLLAVLAAVIYFWGGATRPARDLRTAVPVEHFTLSNGLTVVVMPNTRLPIVSHMMVVKAGGADDPYGKSGLAHYLEHLLFTGSKNFPEGEYDRAIGRIGGSQNAYTTRDYTLYYSTVPREHLSLVMSMEADRFASLTFDTALAARELKVITEERALRVENNPLARWLEQLDAMTFLNHPYRQPVIGWAEDIERFTVADAQAFFARYYRPSNMVLVVAGDVRVRDVRRYAQRYYGGLPAGEAVPRAWPSEPPPRLVRRAEMRDAQANEPRLMRQYMAPSVMHGVTGNAVPLSVLAQYMGGGDSSMLYRALVREGRLATEVRVSYDPMAIGPGLFRIIATPAPGVALTELEAGLDRALTAMLAAPLDAQGLVRARTLLTAEITFAQDGVEPLARIIAELYATGLDEQYFYGWAEVITKSSDEAVLAAARRLFTPEASVTGWLLPKPAALPASTSSPLPPVVPVTQVPHAGD